MKCVLSMFSEALRILDRNTVQLMIDDLKEELEGTHSELEQKTDELEQITNELEEKDRQLDIKEKRIKELEALLMQR